MPNPVYSFPVNINLKGLCDKPVFIDIYNIKGQKVAELNLPPSRNSELTISFAQKQLCSGVYFMKVKNGSKSLKHKFVVVK